MSETITGSYTSALDMQNKYDAYMKLLKASSNIQRMNTDAFRRKQELGDRIPRDLDEMPLYANEQERQLDVIAQKKKARENLREILKNEKDVRDAMALLEKQPSTDPFDGSLSSSPYAVFNLYFKELQERVKNLTGVRPSVLMKYYARLLDEKQADLLPNAVALKEIIGQLNLLKQQGASNTEELIQRIKTTPLSEQAVNQMQRIIDSRGVPQNVVDSVERVATGRSTSAPAKSARTKKDKLVQAFEMAQIADPTFMGGLFERAGVEPITLYRTESEYSKKSDVPSVKRLDNFIDGLSTSREMAQISRLRVPERTVEEEKVALTEGTGYRGRGRPRRIVGGGIEIKPREADWWHCGIFRISKNLLKDNQLSVYYANSLGRPPISKLKKTVKISDKMKDALIYLLKKQELHLPTFYKLSKNEQSLIMDLLKTGKCRDILDESFGGEIPSIHSDELDHAMSRFDLIRGQIMAGNNHPELLKELAEHVDTMYQHRKISNEDRVNIYRNLMGL
jgi:hypothetical protein